MTHLNLGSLRLILSWEQPDPSYEEEQEEKTEVFAPPLSLHSPSSEQRKAYLRHCKQRRRLGSGLQDLLIRPRNTYQYSGGPSVVPVPVFNTY